MNFLTAKDGDRKRSNIGLFFIAVTGGIGAAISIVSFSFVSPAFRRICLPYVPATTRQVDHVLEALKGRSGSLIDLGSGDGRIVFAAAKIGFKAHGIELNPWLVWYSRLTASITGLSSKTAFLRCDLWKYNLRQYDNIILFGVEQMMKDVETKFVNELQKDSLIVTCRFPLPTMKTNAVIGHGVDTVWVYRCS